MTPAALSPAVGGTSPRFARLDLPSLSSSETLKGRDPLFFFPALSFIANPLYSTPLTATAP